MVEDTLCTALRGGDGSCTVGVQVATAPMARSSLEASLDQPASWHIKVVKKASVKGKIYVGVETVEMQGTVAMLIGTNWFDENQVGSAVFYSSDGDICRGNQIVMSTGMGYGDGDVIGIQIVDRQLMFLKNGEPVGEPIPNLKQWVRAAVQMHRPGDKLLLLRELAGPAAGKDIARTKVLKEEKEKAEEEAIRRREEAKIAYEAELLRREQAKKEAAQRALEEEQRRAEEDARRKQEEALECKRAAELERLRKERLEEEKRRLAELRRAKQAKEEEARKKAAEEQIKKVARSRGLVDEEPDPDAPDEAEIQAFMRNCLPLRLTAARQMGMVALPVASKVASMKVMLTPQQHYAVKKHLTEVKRGKKKANQAEVETIQ